MLCVLFLTLLLASSYANHVRIINGTDAMDGEFPFAALLRLNGEFHCGATILNEKFVLTAAHCVSTRPPTDASAFSIQYGYTTLPGNNSRVVQAVNVQWYPLFFFPEHDVAVVELAEPLPQDGSWAPVTLAQEFDATEEHLGTIIGWGTTDFATNAHPDTLQKLEVTTYTDDFCGSWGSTHADQTVCLGSETGSTCFGDSGTALLVDEVQVGITSWVSGSDCSAAGKAAPSGYTRVPTYLDFILEVAGDVKIAKK